MNSIVKLRVPAAAMLAGLFVSLALRQAGAQEQATPEPATKQVRVQNITLDVPENWRQTQPSSQLRLGQFAIPAATGDAEGTELVVFSFAGGGGGVDENLRRWIDQFRPAGREVKLTQGKSTQGTYHFADVQGTYEMPVGPPVLGQTKPLEGARMLGVILRHEKGVYYLRMAGPKATVAAQSEALRKAIGASSKEETAYEMEAVENGR